MPRVLITAPGRTATTIRDSSRCAPLAGRFGPTAGPVAGERGDGRARPGQRRRHRVVQRALHARGVRARRHPQARRALGRRLRDGRRAGRHRQRRAGHHDPGLQPLGRRRSRVRADAGRRPAHRGARRGGADPQVGAAARPRRLAEDARASSGWGGSARAWPSGRSASRCRCWPTSRTRTSSSVKKWNVELVETGRGVPAERLSSRIHAPGERGNQHLVNARAAGADEADGGPRSTRRAACWWTRTRCTRRSRRHRSPAPGWTCASTSRPRTTASRRSKNVVLTPHVAGSTEEAQAVSAVMVVEQIIAAGRGEKPHGLHNPEVWDRRRQ